MTGTLYLIQLWKLPAWNHLNVDYLIIYVVSSFFPYYTRFIYFFCHIFLLLYVIL